MTNRCKSRKLRRQQQAPETSLEDDLLQQRIRQQQRVKEAEKKKDLEKMTTPPENDESEFDIRAPLPIRPQHLMLKGMTPSLQQVTGSGFPSLYLQYSQERSPLFQSHHRHRLRQVWHAKYLLENLQIYPRASTLYSRSRKLKWSDHSLPDGMHCSWDMTCKNDLHPSARTFDVAILQGDDDQLPNIATTVQGGWGLFQPPRGRDQRVHALRGYVD
jgi:hypothetical protein